MNFKMDKWVKKIFNKMSYKSEKGKTYKNLIVFLVCLIVFISVPMLVNGDEGKNEVNPMYEKIINYTLPIIRSFEKKEDKKIEINPSKFLNFIGIDIKNPNTILNKEIAFLYFEGVNDVNEEESNIAWNLFKFDDNDIVKNNDKTEEEDTNEVFNPIVGAKPKVFIYHTHTKESYSPQGPGGYFSRNEELNMVGVGEAIKKQLEGKYNISVLHDKTINDDKYTSAYQESNAVLKKALSKYGDFNIIIDLHRDAVGEDNRRIVTTNINGQSMAKVMLVVDTAHKGAEKNLNLATKLKETGDKMYPGLMRDKIDKFYGGNMYFNQNLSGNNVLIEVGAECNTVKEAQMAGKYLADVIAEYLKNAK